MIELSAFALQVLQLSIALNSESMILCIAQHENEEACHFYAMSSPGYFLLPGFVCLMLHPTVHLLEGQYMYSQPCLCRHLANEDSSSQSPAGVSSAEGHVAEKKGC